VCGAVGGTICRAFLLSFIERKRNVKVLCLYMGLYGLCLIEISDFFCTRFGKMTCERFCDFVSGLKRCRYLN
jgi:hypothetical protein